ncbi:MAG TPA: hypothetical protein ENH32_01875 [Proteobacteria bacterium]|nr:hypothetical protein BMS3Abin14_01978 [bacterium BMS3Abin14]HDL52705.1 hypothetical protein [Pseudomonadota bacterium]
MAKRRRQIKKQRKAAEDTGGAPRAADGMVEDVGEQIPDEELVLPQEEKRVETVDEAPVMVSPTGPEGFAGTDTPPPVPAGWFGRNKENFLLGLLVLYVLLLGLGTAGELFEVEWILHLPIFK